MYWTKDRHPVSFSPSFLGGGGGGVCEQENGHQIPRVGVTDTCEQSCGSSGKIASTLNH